MVASVLIHGLGFARATVYSCVFFGLFLASFTARAQNENTQTSKSISASAIVQKSLQANQRDWEAEAQFDYLEQDCERDGKKTYEKTMMLGSPYQRLVEADGKALSALQQDEEKQKMQRAWTQRRNESPRARDRRIAKYESERRRDQMLMDEMVKAFDFNLQAEAKVDGHDVYVLQAKPRPGYQPPTLETKALTGMEGTLWIDKETFQWVKVEAKVVRPVAMGGILAKLEPGTHFELEKVPVAPGIWLPKHFAMASKAKILLFHNYENRQEENYFNFRRTGRDAHQASNRNPAATDASQ